MAGDPTESRIQVASEVCLRVLSWPGEEEAPILLVHGLASNCRTWERVAIELDTRGHPVAAVDLRGHGRSDKPEHGYDFATLCTDLLAGLDSLGWERCIVAGQSLGGNLVVDLARRAPDRLAGIVGVDGGAIELSRKWPSWEDCASKLAPPRFEGTPLVQIEEMLRRAHPSWSPWGIEATLANLDVQADETVRPWLARPHHMSLLRSLWEHRPSEVLANLEVPAMLLLASDGRPGTEEARRSETAAIVEGAPEVEVRWFSPADHDIHVQKPQDVADALHAAAKRWWR